LPPESTPAPGTAALVRVNLVAAVAFTLGGSLFALGALFAERGVGSTTTVNVTYLVGGFFFSLGGYTSIVLALNLVTLRRPGSDAPRLSWWGLLPRDLGWRSAMVLFVGTLFFAVSLVAAFASGLTPRQSDGWIWLPDIIGCVCFLVSGQLALLDLGEGHVDVRLRDLGWWIAAINQFGSVLFFLAGLAAFVRPATSEVVNVGLVNWGTFAGAACFAIAGFAQIFDRPSLGERMVESPA
jgi:hypothetical protein